MSEHPQATAGFPKMTRAVFEATEDDEAQVVVERAVEIIPPCEHSTMTLSSPRAGGLRTVASTSELALQADRLQYGLGQGPCVDAATHEEVCLLDDVAVDTRWPDWSRHIDELGLRSVLSVRLSGADRDFGALNLFSSRARGFGADDVDLAIAYGAVAGHVLASSEQVRNLQIALHSRHHIGVAQGVLMQRYGLTLDQSFSLLQRYSSHTNTKLRDIAAFVVDHGALPPDAEASVDQGS